MQIIFEWPHIWYQDPHRKFPPRGDQPGSPSYVRDKYVRVFSLADGDPTASRNLGSFRSHKFLQVSTLSLLFELTHHPTLGLVMFIVFREFI
jgi:hypothetical protein